MSDGPAVLNLGYASCLRGYAKCPIILIVSYLGVRGSQQVEKHLVGQSINVKIIIIPTKIAAPPGGGGWGGGGAGRGGRGGGGAGGSGG